MFIITYRPSNNRDHSQSEFCNDTKTIGDIVLNITGKVEESEKAMKWCSNATFGAKVTRRPDYKIECINEVEIRKGFEQAIGYITHILGLNYQFIGIESDAIVYTIDDGTSRIGLKADGNYFVTVNRITKDHDIENVFSYKTRNIDDFQTKTVIGIENIIKKQIQATSKSANTWHKMYWSGNNRKQNSNDSIMEYYKDSGEKIVVNYKDWRHKEVACYSVRDAHGNSVGTTTKLYEAQKLIDLRK